MCFIRRDDGEQTPPLTSTLLLPDDLCSSLEANIIELDCKNVGFALRPDKPTLGSIFQLIRREEALGRGPNNSVGEHTHHSDSPQPPVWLQAPESSALAAISLTLATKNRPKLGISHSGLGSEAGSVSAVLRPSLFRIFSWSKFHCFSCHTTADLEVFHMFCLHPDMTPHALSSLFR